MRLDGAGGSRRIAGKSAAHRLTVVEEQNELSLRRTPGAAFVEGQLETIAFDGSRNGDRRLNARTNPITVFGNFPAGPRDAIARLLQLKIVPKLQAFEPLVTARLNMGCQRP